MALIGDHEIGEFPFFFLSTVLEVSYNPTTVHLYIETQYVQRRAGGVAGGWLERDPSRDSAKYLHKAHVLWVLPGGLSRWYSSRDVLLVEVDSVL